MPKRLFLILPFAAAVASATLGAATLASAQARVDLRINVAPPLARVETPPPPPSPEHYWVPGHWQWERNEHVWVGGHWEAARAGQAFIRPYWMREGNAWVFHSGHWINVAPPPEFVGVRVNSAPPLPRVEAIPAAPSVEHFWVPGHWRWQGGGRFVWVAGYWERHRVGAVWIPAHWIHSGPVWEFVGGHWQAA
jgi:hypothetical protein